MNLNRCIGVQVGFFVFAAALNLSAATNGFMNPPFRGSANTQFGYWENFAVPVGAPGNLPDQPGATTTAVLTQSQPNGTIAGSGNLYNPGGTSSFSLTNATPFALGTVILQIRTGGTELDYNSVSLVSPPYCYAWLPPSHRQRTSAGLFYLPPCEPGRGR